MNPVHFHLLFNHVAILSAVFSILIFSAGLIMSDRVLVRTAMIGFIFSALITIPVSVVLLLLNGDYITPSPKDWIYIACMGALTQAAQFFMTKAFQGENVGTIAIFTNMGIIYAILNGIFFFDEMPAPIAWLGIVVVLTGLILNIIYTGFFKKSKSEEIVHDVESVSE